jgi:hypothetical protein
MTGNGSLVYRMASRTAGHRDTLLHTPAESSLEVHGAPAQENTKSSRRVLGTGVSSGDWLLNLYLLFIIHEFPSGVRYFTFEMSRLALEPIHPPVRGLPGTLYLGE